MYHFLGMGAVHGTPTYGVQRQLCLQDGARNTYVLGCRDFTLPICPKPWSLSPCQILKINSIRIGPLENKTCERETDNQINSVSKYGFLLEFGKLIFKIDTIKVWFSSFEAIIFCVILFCLNKLLYERHLKIMYKSIS